MMKGLTELFMVYLKLCKSICFFFCSGKTMVKVDGGAKERSKQSTSKILEKDSKQFVSIFSANIDLSRSIDKISLFSTLTYRLLSLATSETNQFIRLIKRQI